MSLQKKIEQEMTDLAIQIIRRAGNLAEMMKADGDDKIYLEKIEKLRKMCAAWFDLKRLLEMANSVVEIDTKMSKDKKAYDKIQDQQHL